MKPVHPPTSRAIAAAREHGVVLFVALIAMVVLSLAGVALIRSMDTTGSVAGNLAFRQASTIAVNRAIEKAVDAIYVSKTINPEADDAAHNYYAKLQVGEMPNGAPAEISGTYSAMKAAYKFGAPDVYPATNAEVRWVIERVCSTVTPAGPLTFAQKLQYCDELAPKQSQGKTTGKLGGVQLSPYPLYRVTIRVDLPGTNAATTVQAMLH